MAAEVPATKRLFFALWPDEAARARLAESVSAVVAGIAGRPVPVENWHVTVAFLGDVDAEQQRCVEAAADAVVCPAFTLSLNQYGYWPRPQVVWLGAQVCPAALQALVRDLGLGLRGCGIQLDDRPFAVHLTLLRKVHRRPVLTRAEPIAWSVEALALVESELSTSGATYRVVRSWPLRE